MKLSVCLPTVFGGIPVREAMGLARRAGAKAVEIWGWSEDELSEILCGLKEEELFLSAMCTQMVALNDPKQRPQFLNGLSKSVAAAKELTCPILIAQAGQDLSDVPREKQRESIVEGLKEAARILEKRSIILAIEPLNTLVDHPGYFLTQAKEAFDIIRAVGSSNVKVLYDVYHQQVTEGNILSTIHDNLELIAHIHIAGVPGRHEPHRESELDCSVILKSLKHFGYKGFVGLEYFPKEEPEKGIQEMIKMVSGFQSF